MLAQQPPIYLVSLGRVYRRDTPDATHTPTFHQVEGLAVDRGITLADLSGTLELLRPARSSARSARCGCGRSFFPFTEPSVEFDVTCYLCDGAGCAVCRHSGWIEMGGAGMVDPAVFEAVGYDPEEWTGFAFGLGHRADRDAAATASPTCALFWDNDLRLLRQF